MRNSNSYLAFIFQASRLLSLVCTALLFLYPLSAPLTLQTMKSAFKLASVPLLFSCLPVCGVCGKQPWCRQPQRLELALEQSIRCFFMCIALIWEERQALGTLSQRHRVEKVSNMLLICAEGGVSAERNFVMPEKHSSVPSESVPTFLLDSAHSGARSVFRRVPSLSITLERHRQGGNLQLH